MAKRNDPVSRARGRKPAPVKKPFPVGFAVGCLALALFLGSIITYAVLNTGLGDKSSKRYAESKIGGLRSVSNLNRNHRDNPMSYPDAKQAPPVGGDHNSVPQSCQVYTAAIASEHAVHSLEHGAVWVTYNPDKASPGDIKTLKALVEGNPDRLLSPYPGLKKAVSLQAWGEQVFVDKVSDKRVKEFLDLFTKGPQTLERSATCVGTTVTGPLTAAPVTPPKPTTRATPAPTPTKK